MSQSIALPSLVAYLDDYLSVNRIKDYCPNGLQVEGKSQVSTILGGVTASQALIDQAIQSGVDAILVHHGYFWKGEDQTIRGMKRHRLKALLENDISLLAYHLPLDVHSEIGNNVQLARQLGFRIDGDLEPDATLSIGLSGSLDNPIGLNELSEEISKRLGRGVTSIPGGDHKIKTIAWCTGGAQGYIDKAVALGVDAYLSGEISEPTVHTARECGVHYLSAGHHATERYGVQALGLHLKEKFGIGFEFADIDNPA